MCFIFSLGFTQYLLSKPIIVSFMYLYMILDPILLGAACELSLKYKLMEKVIDLRRLKLMAYQSIQ